MTRSAILSTKALRCSAGARAVHACIALLLTFFFLASASAARATGASEEAEVNPDGPPLTLVFSDDFSTDPNTNGRWTIHRYAGDRSTEAAWDSAARAWGSDPGQHCQRRSCLCQLRADRDQLESGIQLSGKQSGRTTGWGRWVCFHVLQRQGRIRPAGFRREERI